MGTCFMPAMTRLEDRGKVRNQFCTQCKEELACSCVWNVIRAIQEELSENDERISDIENIGCEVRLILMEENINRIAEDDMKSFNKKPYRCPICYGDGEIELTAIELIVRNKGMKFKNCHGCEAKGIVWG